MGGWGGWVGEQEDRKREGETEGGSLQKCT